MLGRSSNSVNTATGRQKLLLCPPFYAKIGTRFNEVNLNQKLDLPEGRHVLAAEGWLGLGCPVEARAELNQIPSLLRLHPEVLKVRWGIYAAEKKWNEALEVAGVLTEIQSEEAIGWVNRSFSLHELKRTQEARANLLQVISKFPADPIVHYNLACYECQLGDMDQARKWLESAFRLGDRNRMKPMALEDPDLRPLWAALKSDKRG